MREGNPYSKSWPRKKVDELIRLLNDGTKTSDCVERLGVSRNAIIGKVHMLRRHGFDVSLTGKGNGHPPAKANSNKKILKKNAPLKSDFSDCYSMRCDVIESHELPDENPKMIVLADLQTQHCHYPIGDPRSEDFAFCGCDVASIGLPYCKYHMRVAYRPTPGMDKRLLKKAYR